MKLHLVYVALLLLTGVSLLSFWLTENPLILIGFGLIKFFLISYYFMEMRKAHRIWKLMLYIFVLGIGMGLLIFI